MTELVKDLQNEIEPVVSAANGLVIQDKATYEGAAEFVRNVKTMIKKVKDYWNEPKAKAKAAHAEICDKEKEMLKPLVDAETVIKNKMGSYQRLEAEKVRKEQERLQAIADEKARKERERLQKQAEKLKTPELKEQRLAEAEQVEAPQITVQTEAPKTEGVHTRRKWKGLVINKVAFIKYVMDGNHSLLYLLEVNQGKLDKYAAMNKGEFDIPGIQFDYEDVPVVKGF